MIIYGDYTTDDLILNLPCTEIKEIGTIYPIRIIDYKKFINSSQCLRMTKEKLKIKEDISNLKLAFFGMIRLYEEILKIDDAKYLEKLVIDEFKSLLKLVTKKDFEFGTYGDKIAFTSEVGEEFFEVNEENFDDLREIVFKQNVIVEEVEYEDKEVNKWLKKARKAHNKNGGIEFAEMVALVKNNGGLTYKEVCNQNIFQLYIDFKTITLSKSYDTSILFKTVSDKVESVDYTKLNIDEMFKVNEHLKQASGLYKKLS